MDLKMTGKTVLISGGTSGIGLAAARLLLAEGARAMLMGRSAERGASAVEALRKAVPSGEAAFIQGDVSQETDCRRAVTETVRRWQGIDVLINSAGIYRESSLEDLREEELDAIFAVNVKGTFLLTQAALPALKKSRGAVVNVASDAGVHGNYGCSAYCASKGAVVLFTRALALDMASFGVRVNAIAPGDILTPLTEAQLREAPDAEGALREMASVYPVGRIGTAEEAAAVIAFLSSGAASFVTGAVWGVDGGLTA